MSKLIVLSGKMGCGKDTLIDHMSKYLTIKRAECKESLHRATMTLFGISEKVYWSIYNNRKEKEKPNTLFNVSPEYALKLKLLLGSLVESSDIKGCDKFPLTIREAMILTSELVMKPMFGEDVFGIRRVELLRENNLIFFDGSFGFVSELQPAIKELGQDNILGVRILGRDTGGADSRSILPEGILKNTVDIWNGDDVTLDEFLEESKRVILEWLYLND